MVLAILMFLLCHHYLMELSANFQVVFWTCFWSLSLFVFQSHKTFHVEESRRTQHLPLKLFDRNTRNILACLSHQSRRHRGALVSLSPPNKSPSPQIGIWNTTNQWNFCQILMSSPPCSNVKPPLLMERPPIDDFLATVLFRIPIHEND